MTEVFLTTTMFHHYNTKDIFVNFICVQDKVLLRCYPAVQTLIIIILKTSYFTKGYNPPPLLLSLGIVSCNFVILIMCWIWSVTSLIVISFSANQHKAFISLQVYLAVPHIHVISKFFLQSACFCLIGLPIAGCIQLKPSLV